jgi:hypothetical protein
MTMETRTPTNAAIEAVARQISKQPMGLAFHRPEPWAQASNCFRNVERKVAESGGRAQFGWTFHHRLAEKMAGLPLYLYATHHAVWVSPDGKLIDVTPYPNPRHEPIGQGGDPLFLMDDSAGPVPVGGQPAPLPLRFFAIDDNQELRAYVDELNQKEQEACRQLYSQRLSS